MTKHGPVWGKVCGGFSPEARVVGTVHHIEDGGHVDCGGCLHLLEQGLQVSASDAMVMIIMIMVMVIRLQSSTCPRTLCLCQLETSEV